MTNDTFPHVKPLYEQVLELIEAKIISGEYSVGDKLPTENELAAKYHVSRMVVREAIKVLKEKGWVETQVAKGTFVVGNVRRGVDKSFDAAIRMDPTGGFGNLIEVRLVLEPEIAAMAATRASDEEIERMQQAVQLMDTALKEEENDWEEFLKGDYAFHTTMAEATNNPLIPMIISPVVQLMRDFQMFHLSHVKGGSQRSQHNHHLIMDAIRQHNPEEARKYMYAHIVQVRDDVKSAGQ